jgi:Ras-related protein Rap-1B
MKTGQGFLLVFSITSLSSLTELAELREQIIRIKDDENVPIVIVGNKSDLEEHRVVSRTKAFSISQSWGNAPYYETSARRRGAFFLLRSAFVHSHHFPPHNSCRHTNGFFLPTSPSLHSMLFRAQLTPRSSFTANVDEVFVDLCRQIIRRDTSRDYPIMTYPHNVDYRGERHLRPRRRRRRDRDRDSGGRCTIL